MTRVADADFSPGRANPSQILTSPRISPYPLSQPGPQPTQAPSVKKRTVNLLREVFGLPLNIIRKLINIFWFLVKLPSAILVQINDVCERHFSRSTLNRVSWLQVKLFTLLVRILVFNLKLVFRLVRWAHGDLCIAFPDIPVILLIFHLIGGKICPFTWFNLDTVEVKTSHDDRYWEVLFPFEFHDVDIIFARLAMRVPFGLPEPGVGGFNLTANDVMLNFTLRFTKTVFPTLVPLKSITDTAIQVEGCTGNQPGIGWIGNEILKYAMKMCDPVLNEILKIVLFTGKMNMELVNWAIKTFIHGGEWVGHIVVRAVDKVTHLFSNTVG